MYIQRYSGDGGARAIPLFLSLKIRNVKSIIYASAQAMLSFKYVCTIEILEWQRITERVLERGIERKRERERDRQCKRIRDRVTENEDKQCAGLPWLEWLWRRAQLMPRKRFDTNPSRPRCIQFSGSNVHTDPQLLLVKVKKKGASNFTCHTATMMELS